MPLSVMDTAGAAAAAVGEQAAVSVALSTAGMCGAGSCLRRPGRWRSWHGRWTAAEALRTAGGFG